MLIAAALLLASQTAPCTATDAGLPAPLAGWTMPGDSFEPGKPVELQTVDAATLKGLPAGTKPGRAAMIGFRVETAGTYGIALGGKGWIDVLPVAGGAALKSTAHGHGPACSTIVKIVRFALQPGVYTVAVNGLAATSIKIMLVKD